MKSVSILAAACSVLSVVGAPLSDSRLSLVERQADPTAPATITFVFQPQTGKGPQLLNLFAQAEAFTKANATGNLFAYGYKVSGQEQYVYTESYVTLKDALAYASTPQHTQFVQELFQDVNILALQAYSSFGIGDLFGISS
ncbi:hypothetical protein BGW36DRAFT_463164 [Talaromyces proteolyticus]|uniref:Stress-response A/B barrel domain-containing protein n=1 Tax=Talaromyces proteolyticus TaxID=1131652 RepID=A0AAD4KNH4_9EURO|nr:uncharacterized protein BGW36DRAFT_463164 [Talaromyces proteolyticus]KAH8695611.1 hypothetical protein BGW36DRAFT_463164 [Talaromyces proteolyticus]